MRSWKDARIQLDQSILDALSAIEKGAMQIALVVDNENRLKGVITDGDIRAHILQGRPLEQSVTLIMNRHPIIVSPSSSREERLRLLKEKTIHQLPLVDGSGKLVGLTTLDELLQTDTRSNLVVLMAGGMGNRLRPLTENIPKPMLRIGERPIIETIILQFKDYGFTNFMIAKHYLGGIIESYFRDGSHLGATISYLSEVEPLGTAGALSLLDEIPKEPFFVMNADLLTKLNFSSLLNFHQASGAPMTMCVREHALTIPYGVVEIDQERIVAVTEKPTQRHMVNAGIYVCNPSVVNLLPHGRPYTMVDLAHELIKQENCPAVFPIHEYWLDIGRHSDFESAVNQYDQIFG